MKRLLDKGYYNRPYICSNCGGNLIFKGVGEYHCEMCKAVEYDDYGKVRIYLEKHRGANISQIEAATGVDRKAIQQMVKEERFDVTQDSRISFYCERCHTKIKSGRFCSKCELEYNKELEEKSRIARNIKMEGVAMETKDSKGAKRFERQ
ncbi:MAG: hypothetical protein NC412_04030 [Roseburia sp.]|nr:hypothetical protein [Roseburia sp.]MCM1278232.1 hypothetical protein [Robinsoniella sp.]